MAVFTLAVKAASSVYSPTPRWVVLSVWVAQAERPSAAAAITAPRVLDTRIRIRITYLLSFKGNRGNRRNLHARSERPLSQNFPRGTLSAAQCARDGAGFFAVRGFAGEDDRVIERRRHFSRAPLPFSSKPALESRLTWPNFRTTQSWI